MFLSNFEFEIDKNLSDLEGHEIYRILEMNIVHQKIQGEDNERKLMEKAQTNKIPLESEFAKRLKIDKSIIKNILKSGDTDATINALGAGLIRVTGACEGGDLLESKGDGTAKVQDDDIIRSKTIAKVTVGNSGSGVNLIPCVFCCG